MMSWINTLRTSAEDLGTLAEKEPPTQIEVSICAHTLYSTVRAEVPKHRHRTRTSSHGVTASTSTTREVVRKKTLHLELTKSGTPSARLTAEVAVSTPTKSVP